MTNSPNLLPFLFGLFFTGVPIAVRKFRIRRRHKPASSPFSRRFHQASERQRLCLLTQCSNVSGLRRNFLDK